MSVPIISGAADRARRAEEAGWDGITFTDSQNLCPDPFVVFAVVAEGTERIQLATGVTNVHTRHPAALATAAATVNELAGGRFVLGTTPIGGPIVGWIGENVSPRVSLLIGGVAALVAALYGWTTLRQTSAIPPEAVAVDHARPDPIAAV